MCLELIRKKNYEQCLVIAEPLARSGSHIASVLMAQIYLQGGSGVDRNVVCAESWQRRALEIRDTASARIDLAKILLIQDDIVKQRQGLKMLIALTKSQRSAKIFITLGAVFADGIIVRRDTLLALKLFARTVRESKKLRLSIGAIALGLIAVASCPFRALFPRKVKRLS